MTKGLQLESFCLFAILKPIKTCLKSLLHYNNKKYKNLDYLNSIQNFACSWEYPIVDFI